MLPLVIKCHTHYHLHPFHFVLFKVKDLVAKQHPTSEFTVHELHTLCVTATNINTRKKSSVKTYPTLFYGILVEKSDSVV